MSVRYKNAGDLLYINVALLRSLMRINQFNTIPSSIEPSTRYAEYRDADTSCAELPLAADGLTLYAKPAGGVTAQSEGGASPHTFGSRSHTIVTSPKPATPPKPK
jgi:hypothetical protein